MIAYLACFAISAMMLYIAEHITNKVQYRILVISAILLLSILAGCRGYSVGTDVAVYGAYNFYDAHAAGSFLEYFNSYITSITCEPLYHLTVYIGSRLSANYHMGLFLYNLLVLTFAYLGMKRYKEILHTPMWLGMLLYWLALYNVSLNIMRQSIAVAVVFWGTSYLFERKYVKYLLIILFGLGFHSSAVGGLLFLMMFLIFDQKRVKGTATQLAYATVFLVVIVAALLIGSSVIIFLVDKGILRDNYLIYIPGHGGVLYSIPIWTTLMYAGYFILYMVHYEMVNARRLYSLFFGAISMMMVLLVVLVPLSESMNRISYYLMPLQAVSLANIANCHKGISRRLWNALIIVYSLCVWWVIFVYSGDCETVPYVFDLSMI